MNQNIIRQLKGNKFKAYSEKILSFFWKNADFWVHFFLLGIFIPFLLTFGSLLIESLGPYRLAFIFTWLFSFIFTILLVVLTNITEDGEYQYLRKYNQFKRIIPFIESNSKFEARFGQYYTLWYSYHEDLINNWWKYNSKSFWKYSNRIEEIWEEILNDKEFMYFELKRNPSLLKKEKKD